MQRKLGAWRWPHRSKNRDSGFESGRGQYEYEEKGGFNYAGGGAHPDYGAPEVERYETFSRERVPKDIGNFLLKLTGGR